MNKEISIGFPVKLMAVVLVLILATLACTVDMSTTPESQSQGQNQPVDEGDNLQKTQVAQQEIELGIQQTQLAQTQTQMAVQPTNTTAPLPTNTVAPPPTEAAPTQAPPTAEPQPTATIEEVEHYPDLEMFLMNVDILLFEDMAGDFETSRFIKKALDNLGVPYTDVKDASGNFKNALLNGPGYGGPWDLIIAGNELRTGTTGEFFEYFSDALYDGSSLILEVWDMDSFVNGKIQLLLTECGIEYQADWYDPGLDEQLLTLHAPDHPIAFIYNENIRMTSLLDYWGWFPDKGDLMQVGYTGDAEIIFGARAATDTAYGTVVSCIQDRMVLQTHSTHAYAVDRAVPLWENYIITTLLARYFYLYPDAEIDV